jgi:hypothetical protein
MNDRTMDLGTDGLGVPAHFGGAVPAALPAVPAPRDAPGPAALPSPAALTALAPWAQRIEVPGMDCGHGC